MFYDIFEEICKERGTTPVQVRKDLGISHSTVSSWKSRGLTPNPATLSRLAEYLSVPVEQLIGTSAESNTTPLNSDMLRFLSVLELSSDRDFAHNFTALLKALDMFGDMQESFSTEKLEQLGPAIGVCQYFAYYLKDHNQEQIYKIAKLYRKWNREARELIREFEKLNANGRNVAVARLRELAMIPMYQNPEMRD